MFIYRDSQKVSAGGGIGDGERIEIVEYVLAENKGNNELISLLFNFRMDHDEAKKLIWCRDEEAPNPRTLLTLMGLCWFFYEHLPAQK